MGMDIEGGMVIGGRVSDIKLDDDIDLGDWVYENEMEPMSPWYDAGPENWVIGFKVHDIEVDKMDEDWLKDIKAKAVKFTELTGAKASLIAESNVW